MQELDDLRRSIVQILPPTQQAVLGGWLDLFEDSKFLSQIVDSYVRMIMDALTYLPDYILVKVERAAMAESLEKSAPFLGLCALNYSSWLPVNVKILNRQGEWILKQLLNRYTSENFVERPKIGFSVPSIIGGVGSA